MKMRNFVFGLLALMTSVAFQNCGDFSARSMSESDLASLGGSTLMWLAPGTSLRAGSPIEFRTRMNDLPAGSELIWDHEFGDGSSFCSQTSSLDRLSVTFLCPTKGALRVKRIAILSNGQETMEMVEVLVADETGAPVPTPTPTTPQTSGAQLYSQHCAGCHGGFANSNKKNNITLQRLNTAITGRDDMRSLVFLTTDQRQAIVNALTQ